MKNCLWGALSVTEVNILLGMLKTFFFFVVAPIYIFSYSISALQTAFMMTGSKTLYEMYKDHGRTDEWSEQNATFVLNAWHNKFTAEVAKVVRKETEKDTFTVFADYSLTPVFASFSEVRPIPIIIGFSVLVIRFLKIF